MDIKTVELTKLATRSCSWQWRNFSPAQVSFLLGMEMPDVAPFAYKELVRCTWRGKTVLEGTVRKCSPVLSGASYMWQVDAYDHYKPLEGTAFISSDKGKLKASLSTAGGISSSATEKRKVKILDSLKAVLDDARKHGALVTDYVLDVDATAWAWDTEVSCDQHASLLRKILAKRPGMVAWFDYSSAVSVLHIADGDRLDPVALDRIRHRLGKISLVERWDLVPPAVGVVLTRGMFGARTVVYPRGASLRQEGCTIVQMEDNIGDPPQEDDDDEGVDGDSYNFSKPEVMVLGEKLPTGPEDAREWWIKKIPELARVPKAQFGAIKQDTPAVEGQDAKNYSKDATKYELVYGSLSESCVTIKWCETLFKQYVYLDANTNKGVELLFPKSKEVTVNGRKVKRYYHWLTWRGITTNTRKRYYKADRHGTIGPEDGSPFPEEEEGGNAQDAPWTDYLPVLEEYYKLTRTPPWAGSVDALTAIRPDLLVGRRLSITSANPAWQEMLTVIQGVTVDLFSGNTVVSTGVPDHLSLQTMIDRQKQLYEDADGQDDQEEGGRTWSQNLTYDPKAKISPKAPVVGPRGEVIWTAATPEPPDYGFQVHLEYDDEGNKTGAKMTPGKLMLNGKVIGTAPGSTELPMMEGEVWLMLTLNSSEVITSMYIGSVESVVDPFFLASYDGARPERSFYYSFPLAVIKGDEVIQYALGTIQLPVAGGTHYPWGP